MFSLPPITPREDLWSFPLHRGPTPSDGHILNNPNPSINTTNQQPRRPTPQYTSALSLLNQDEAAVRQRKFNIQRFGAAWIRPPGVAKTYQQRMDEDAERAEQAELARREAQMLELAAAEQSALNVDAGDQGEEGLAEERDLDADVPDADDADVDDDEADVTFNEESLIEGSALRPETGGEDSEEALSQRMVALEEAELDGRLQEERDLGLERDLDDDVPEAGSYEHTDSEAELESSEDEQMQRDVARRSIGRAIPGPNTFGRRSLVSEDSEIGSSSFLGSSPVLSRRHGNGDSLRVRRMVGGRNEPRRSQLPRDP